MSLFKRKPGIDEYVKEYQGTAGAVLIDVREPGEYRAGHIPDAINIPLSQISNAQNLLPDQVTKLYVYCLSGGRSSRAVGMLQKLGYEDVKNIGGINSYKGQVEK